MEKEILNEQLLTVTEASKVLRINRGLVISLIASHKIKAFRVGKKKYLIPANAVREFLENSEV